MTLPFGAKRLRLLATVAAFATCCYLHGLPKGLAGGPASPSNPSRALAADQVGVVGAVPGSSLVMAVRERLANSNPALRAHKDDVAAARAAYDQRADALWIADGALSDRAKEIVDTVADATSWGLNAQAFDVPVATASFASSDEAAAAELRITLAALTYARHARGGRLTPSTISQMIFMTPQLEDPAQVLARLASSSSLGLELTSLHPKHEQFHRLKAELHQRLSPSPRETAAPSGDTTIAIPDGKMLKPGAHAAEVALLRRRLGVPAAFAGRQTLFDEDVAKAVAAFQSSHNLKPTGVLDQRTRKALNDPPASRRSLLSSDIQRLIVNMERWRWMPRDLGDIYVLNNLPEFITRTYKDGKIIFQEKIIVGQPSWPTPTFSAQMRTVEFNPSWGVPPGIKSKELAPRLRKAGGGGFFEELFGGGSSGGAAVIRAHGLTPYRGGQPVNPDSIDWSKANLDQFSFVQPPGPKNPLGFVKFMFPNPHNVYMHDTIQRDLFNHSSRPYSHGCIRVQNPGRFAEVLLREDKGWSPERVAAARQASAVVGLDRQIMVHTAYLTAWVDDTGRLATFGDVYGLDSRVSRALGGDAIPSRPVPVAEIETSSTDESGATTAGKKRKKNDTVSSPASNTQRVPTSFSEAMSGLLNN